MKTNEIAILDFGLGLDDEIGNEIIEGSADNSNGICFINISCACEKDSDDNTSTS